MACAQAWVASGEVEVKMGEREKWEVWRQDDNGGEFLMEVVESEEEAKALVEEYTRRGHKQTYWHVRAHEERR